ARAVGDPSLNDLVPEAMPGRDEIVANERVLRARLKPVQLTLAYSRRDAAAPRLVRMIMRKLARIHVTVELRPGARDADVVLFGWSSKIFDEYNILDLFPCGSVFNVSHWCEPQAYDALMRRVARTLDDRARWRME